jgi:hypothetical protein
MTPCKRRESSERGVDGERNKNSSVSDWGMESMEWGAEGEEGRGGGEAEGPEPEEVDEAKDFI